MLDMDDLLEKTHQLLTADADIRHRLAQHYRFALIDEFQDTDPLQWEIIRSLASPDGHLAGDKLFIVGDPKQSIYSFRAADVTVFARVRAAMAAANAAHQRDAQPFCDSGEVLDASPAERLGTLVMGENFRTLAQPVAFVNALFPKFMQAVPDEPFQVGYDPLVGCRPTDVSEGSVELLLLPPDENRDATEIALREAELVARRLSHLLAGNDLQVADQDGSRPPVPGDIALLLRRRRNLPAYEDALRASGIPFQVAGGRGFYQRQEIYDLANILRVLCNSADGIALMGAFALPVLRPFGQRPVRPDRAPRRTALRAPWRRQSATTARPCGPRGRRRRRRPVPALGRVARPRTPSSNCCTPSSKTPGLGAFSAMASAENKPWPTCISSSTSPANFAARSSISRPASIC